MGRDEHEGDRSRPEGSQLYFGRHGPQRVNTRGARWSDEAETIFLDHLAATANVSASAKACGFTTQALYARRRKDAAFERRWDAALAQGYAHIEALLVQRAIEALEGFEPDPDTPIMIRDMTVKDAMILLGHHRRVVEGRPLKSRQRWPQEVPIGMCGRKSCARSRRWNGRSSSRSSGPG
ncbi:MAG TPA: hypothetical protein VD948_06005 [Rhodothermales bacterium]|nr:hypothetical protein [Rhodothermales bacterium]